MSADREGKFALESGPVPGACIYNRFGMKYHQLMQRLAAAALLAWVNFTLIFAAVRPMTAAESNLPACCRRLGQHGCAMKSPASGPMFQATSCPMYPRGHAVQAQARANISPKQVATFAAHAGYRAAQPQTESHCRISYSRAGQKRGPPPPLV